MLKEGRTLDRRVFRVRSYGMIPKKPSACPPPGHRLKKGNGRRQEFDRKGGRSSGRSSSKQTRFCFWDYSAGSVNFSNNTIALCPPKPNVLLIAMFTLRCTAFPSVRLKPSGIPESSWLRLIVGGTRSC